MVDESIAALEARLNILRERRDSLRQFYDNAQAIQAPIRRLPEETLANVFRHLLSTPPLCMSALSAHFRGQSLMAMSWQERILISFTCRLWRKVMVSNPTLWSDIFIPGDHSYEKESMKLIFAKWLERSGSSPLCISKDSNEECNATPEALRHHVGSSIPCIHVAGLTAVLISTRACTPSSQVFFPTRLALPRSESCSTIGDLGATSPRLR